MWPSETFRQQKIHHNAFAARALPRTPLGELTTLANPPSRLERGIPPPHSLPRTPLVSLDGAFGASTHCPGTNYEKSAPMSIKH